jgi:hypothetical protein
MKQVQHEPTLARYLPTPNRVINADGFYISYNPLDVGIYGDVTTALVLGQMEKFYILKGDHCQGYAPLIGQGFEACIAYFKAHPADIHPYSDKLD